MNDIFFDFVSGYISLGRDVAVIVVLRPYLLV